MSEDRKPRGLLLRLWRFLWNSTVRVLWLCAYAVAAAGSAAAVFAATGRLTQVNAAKRVERSRGAVIEIPLAAVASAEDAESWNEPPSASC